MEISSQFLNLARAGGIRLAISEVVMEETLRVLRDARNADRIARAHFSLDQVLGEFPVRGRKRG
jgi:hypothetical protein